MNKITPLVKGIITGIAMLATSLIFYATKVPASSKIHYIIYIIYAGGIMWSLLDHSKSEAYTGKFGDLFSQGFRCFIVVTLIMVLFTAVMFNMHPEWAEEAAQYYREGLVKEGNKTPAEIDTIVATAKKQFTLTNISGAIFGYLITGSIFTAAGAGLLLMRRK